MLELVERILALMGPTSSPTSCNEARHEIPTSALDAAKAGDVLGWRPRVTLDDGPARDDRLVPRLPARRRDVSVAPSLPRRAAPADLEPRARSSATTPLANALARPPSDLDRARATLPARRSPSARPARSSRSPRRSPPEVLFRDYLYFSSFSDDDARARRGGSPTGCVAERGLGADSLVVEIASNDGYLLQHYARAASRCSASSRPGTSPRSAERRGASRRSREFFGPTLAERAASPRAGAPTCIHANNVLAHVPDLNGFVAGIATS